MRKKRPAREKFHGFRVRLSAKGMTRGEFFELYRKYVIHQYDLFNHRTNWYIAINAVLLGTYGFTLQKRLEVLARRSEDLAQAKIVLIQVAAANWFLCVLSVFGIALSILTYRLLRAASKPIKQLFHEFDKSMDGVTREVVPATSSARFIALPYVVGGFDQSYMERGRKLTEKLPAFMGVAWGFILLLTVGVTEHLDGYPSFLLVWNIVAGR